MMGIVTCCLCERKFASATITEERVGDGDTVVISGLGPYEAGPFCPRCEVERARLLPQLEAYVERWAADFYAPRTDLDVYLFRFHGDLVYEVDRRAAGVLGAVGKAGLRARGTECAWKEFENPDVRQLLSGGPLAFYRAAADRALRKHGDKIELNRCPKCDGVCRTPEAKACIHCNHCWRQ